MRLILTCLILLLGAAGAAAQDRLNGRYLGLNEAEGAILDIEPAGEGFDGRFVDPSGAAREFEAAAIGPVAEGVVDLGGEVVLMQIVPLPFGAAVGLTPFDAEGNLIGARMTRYTFVREGLEVPEPPETFAEAPADARGRITANSFLASYAFWPPEGVANGYLSLAERFRTLMRLFPAVQLDVIFKLCLAPGGERALALALRGQGVTCSAVLDGMAAAQRSGRFNAFKAEVAAAREALTVAVRCGDGYVMGKETCDRSARRVAEAATALETAATVLARYR